MLEQDLFINEFIQMCPEANFLPHESPQYPVSTQGKSRRPRFIDIIIGIVIVSIIAAPVLAIGSQITSSVAVSKANALQTVVEEHERRMKETSEDVENIKKAIKATQTNIGVLANRTIALEEEMYDLKQKFVSANNVFFYLNYRFHYGKQVILNAKRDWQLGKLNPEFFDFMQFHPNCTDDCPIMFGSPRSCVTSHDHNIIQMEISLPAINRTLAIAEPDPFHMYEFRGNQTCEIGYTGPSNILISKHCVYGTNVRVTDIIMNPSTECKNVEANQETSKCFAVKTYRPRQPTDELDFIQVKHQKNLNYIYCKGNSFTYGPSTDPCPDGVFALPDDQEFSINGQKYTPGKYKISS